MCLRRTLVALAWLASVAAGGAIFGQEAAPKLLYPQTVAALKSGGVAVTDRKWPGVLVAVDGTLASRVKGSSKLRERLNVPASVAASPEGVLFVGDLATRDVYRVQEGADPAPLVAGAIGMPTALAHDGQGALYVGDVETHTLWKVADTGGVPQPIAKIKGLRALAFDAQGRLWTLAASEPQLARLASLDGPESKLESIVASGFRFPTGLAVKGDDEWFVSDPYERKIVGGKGANQPTTVLSGDPLVYPTGLAVDAQGALIVADPRAQKLWRVADGQAKSLLE